MRTKQEMFNTVARALMAQGEPSMQHGSCVYRGANGLKCAAGHLIPDHIYVPEHIPASAARIWYPILTGEPYSGKYYNEVLNANGGEEVLDFLGALQRCHDYAALDKGRVTYSEDARHDRDWYDDPERTFLVAWKGYMTQLATDYKLDATVLDG